MPKPPDEDDPQVTDLARYRKARDAELKRRKPPNAKAQMRETILGANPRAGLILVLLAVFGVLYVFGPAILRFIRW